MPLWLARDPLVLASRSAARRSMLEAAGIPIEVSPADIDERSIEAMAPEHHAGTTAVMLAREKARVVSATMPGRLVLGADQTLALGAQRFSKPPDRAAAREQLVALAGRAHELHSALAFVREGRTLFEHVGVTRLTMRTFSDAFIDTYLDAAGNAATASVGGYQLEGLGVHLFERVDGDYFTVLGLPLLPALDFLRQSGYLAR
jgi:septum formation protein